MGLCLPYHGLQVSAMGLPQRSQPAAMQEEDETVKKGSKGMIWGKAEIREGEDSKILLRDLALQSFLF